MTTAHGASGSNNTYWPEIYTNMPIVDEARKHPYRDSPVPRVFGHVSPFDPQLFSSIAEFAGELLQPQRSGKYSPLDVAQWLDTFSGAAVQHLQEMASRSGPNPDAEVRRISADVRIQAGLGRFFAAKLRSATLWSLYERTGDRAALEQALAAYRTARTAWSELAKPGSVYLADITYGMTPHLRGSWRDRLPAIDGDIADMEKRLSAPSGTHAQDHDPSAIQRAIKEVMAAPQREKLTCRHHPPARFRPGDPVSIQLSFDSGRDRSVRLYYRRVNQAERWRTVEMQARDRVHSASIPADYSRSNYPLQYYFEIRNGSESASLYPGFDADLANQPYFVVRQA